MRRSTRGNSGLPLLMAFDLDGTLLRGDGSLSPRTQAALNDLHRRGIVTVFVTGRPPRWVDHLAADVGDHGLVLCSNGAFCYDVRQKQLLENIGIDPQDVAGIVADVRRFVPDAAFAAEMGLLVRRDPAYLALVQRGAGGTHGHAETVGPVGRVRQPVGKLLVRFDSRATDVITSTGPLPLETVFDTIATIVGNRATVVTSGFPFLIEIGPPGVSKGSALERFCQERRIRAKEVWAFGDELNDVEMLQWAGRGFAVGRAHPKVTEVATDVIAGPADDGIADVLERALRTPRSPHARSIRG